ncbi:MAG: hypothetical protein ABR529_06215 [Actinomycetota bacterium]
MDPDVGRPVSAASPHDDLRREVIRVLDASEEAEIVLRVTGGLAVWLRCPSAVRPPLARDFKDLDLVGQAGEARPIADLLGSLGYVPDKEFNQLHGHQRLYFWDPVNERQLDVFIERMTMSHELDLSGRLDIDDRTITLADLLLTKLQVVETNEKDLKDAVAILADHPLDPRGIDPARIEAVLARDWGWWRTAMETLDKVVAYAARLDHFADAATVRRRAEELRRRVDESPKSFKWRARAKVGERVRWYELPEEIQG